VLPNGPRQFSTSGCVPNTPMGRMGRTPEVADVIGFLSPGAAGWLNGQTIVVDGGLI